MKKLIFIFFVLVSIVSCSQDGKPPFWQEIQRFKKQDSAQAPPQNAILFVGSSSFTKWTDIQNYFPDYAIINRGFGGSTLPDVIRYEKDVILKYHPKQVVIYCGDNDLATSDTITSETVFHRFEQLFVDIRAALPDANISYVSIKPSPSRWHLKDKAIRTNQLIKDYLTKQKNTGFINIWDAMLGADGKANPDIFIGDNLHMNAKGYAIWQKIIQPYLKKD